MDSVTPAGLDQMVPLVFFGVLNIIKFGASLFSYTPWEALVLNYYDNRQGTYISYHDLNFWIVIMHSSTGFINRLRWGYT